MSKFCISKVNNTLCKKKKKKRKKERNVNTSTPIIIVGYGFDSDNEKRWCNTILALIVTLIELG